MGSAPPTTAPGIRTVRPPLSASLHAAAPRTEAKPKYLACGDVARVLGTIAVVVGHVCDMVQYSNPTIVNFWVCNFFNSASRWAVPVYIMLSGSLLLDPARKESADVFYRKRLARLGIPIAFWTTFFLLFTVYYLQPHGLNLDVNIWKDLAYGKPYAHLHFIFRIAGLYAFTPMLRVFIQHAPKRLVTLTLVLMLGFSCFNSVTDAFTGSEASAFFRFVPFLGFYLAGYVLRDRKLTGRALAGCWFLALSCVFLLTGGTGLLVSTFGPKLYPSPSYVLYDFLSPVRITLGVSVWLIFVNTFDERWLKTPLSRFISRYLAPATLGIYLVHPLFRELLYVAGWNASLNRSGDEPWVLLGIPLISLLVYVPSVLFTMLIMRIPVVQRIVI